MPGSQFSNKNIAGNTRQKSKILGEPTTGPMTSRFLLLTQKISR